MKTRNEISVALLAIGAIAFGANAQGPGAPEGPGHRPPPPMIMALDANQDRVIDADEIAGAPEALLTLDHNGDGVLSPEDREAAPGGGPGGPPADGERGHRPPPPIIMVLDTNQDRVIDADELAEAGVALLVFDQNGDGELTPEELRPPRRGGRHGGPPSGEPNFN